MSGDEGDGVDGGTATLACASGASEQTNTVGEGRTQSNARADQRLAHTLRDGQRTHSSPHHQTEERGSNGKAHHCMGVLLNECEICCERSNNMKGITDLHCSEKKTSITKP